MLQFTAARELSEFVRNKKQEGLTVGFVPTMGALHEGHLSIVRRSKKENDLTVVSIFVNPIQFNNAADLEKYPRMPETDIQRLAGENCDILFMPSAEEMYPPGDVPPEPELGGLDLVMEGRFRPGHFRGVAIVVKKFFDIVGPDRAYFGQKDFQQLAVIRYMARSLNLPVRIVAYETVREADGLAMSSRNLRLTPAGRALAPKIHETLLWVRNEAPGVLPAALEGLASDRLARVPGFKVEYFEIVDRETLQPVEEWQKGRPAVACTAVYVDDIRLIDNMEVFS